MITPTKRTQAEIDELKANWYADPCWDIEETEGFEAHRDELMAYSFECKSNWDNAHYIAQRDRAIEFGSSIALVEYIRKLETRLDRLEDENLKLQNQIDDLRSIAHRH